MSFLKSFKLFNVVHNDKIGRYFFLKNLGVQFLNPFDYSRSFMKVSNNVVYVCLNVFMYIFDLVSNVLWKVVMANKYLCYKF